MKCDICGQDDNEVIRHPLNLYTAHQSCLDKLSDGDIEGMSKELTDGYIEAIDRMYFPNDMEQERARVNARVNIRRWRDDMLERNKQRREGMIKEIPEEVVKPPKEFNRDKK